MKRGNYALREKDVFKTIYFQDAELCGRYGFPRLEKVERQEIGSLVPFNVIMSSDNKDRWMHFFIDDYQFERVYRQPTAYLSLFRKVRGIVTPDFSLYRDMPRAMQIWNCYRSRAVARFLQRLGLHIVPTVSWSDRESFLWCFDGIERGSAVAISTNGTMESIETREAFLDGFYEMVHVLDPCQIVVVGRIPEQLQRNPTIEAFPSHGQWMKRKLRK